MKTIKEIDIKNKRVLLRLNLNVPIEKGVIQDHFRIKAVIPTIEEVAKHAKKTIIIAHLGRPKGRKDCTLTLQPIANALSDMLSRPVVFLDNVLGERIKQEINEADAGTIFLLENLRFHPEEIRNDHFFGEQLAQLADVYVNDAFGDSAKETASIMIPPRHLPSAIGLRFEQELKNLDKVKEQVEHPFVLIVGGAKIKEKLGVLEELGKQADHILIGGGVANTLFAAQGIDIKQSLYQQEEIDVAKQFLATHKEKIVLPKDLFVAQKIADGIDEETGKQKELNELVSGDAILDIGKHTIQEFIEMVSKAKVVFWAGPLGYFEWLPSSRGSIFIAKALAQHTGFDVVGGGETANVLDMAGVKDEVDFISTGGSAALKYLSNKKLPGIIALESQKMS